ncbi:MAG: B12-binding domain-containing radical SAM protein [Deltaproteobacteria bacterium]|nr:B12-binding domain-containing radical SAM protein [Deltaproteobacteria bacterium]
MPWTPPGERWLDVSPALPDAPAVAAFPGAYPAAMASLGFLAVLREMLAQGLPVHRMSLLDGDRPESIEEGRPLRSYRLVTLSVAWELEAVDAVAALRRAGLEPDPARRGPDDPLVVAGGALTLVNPRPLLAFADAVVVGDGIDAARLLAREALGGGGRARVLEALGSLPNVLLAAEADDASTARRQAAALPIYSSGPGPLSSPVVAEDSAFGDAYLVEACRGCPCGCTYCVLRRGRCGPYVAHVAAKVLAAVPDGVRRVGLVGGGVSDHPDLELLLEALLARGIGATTASLRVAALTERRVRLLAAAGARQLTVGVDGLSADLRRTLGKPLAGERIVELAEAARAAGVESLKLYVMYGLPGELPGAVEEFGGLVDALRSRVRVHVSAGPLVPKPATPLGDAPFAPAAHLRAVRGALRERLGSIVSGLDLGSIRTAQREHALAHADLATSRRLVGVGS